jgi:hypothetical protein
MQSHPIAQFFLTLAALMVSSAILLYAVTTFIETRNARGTERNAKLVEIGVSILRVDPNKEGHINAARHWALDLIDANAGGVKFSAAARTELLKAPLEFDYGFQPGYTDYAYPEKPKTPMPPRPRN